MKGQWFRLQLGVYLLSLCVLADGVGAGGEQPVDGMIRVVLLPPLFRPVLAAGHGRVLRSHPATVFRRVSRGGEEVPPTALTLAGRVAVAHSVDEVIDEEVHVGIKEHAGDEHHFLFSLWVTGKDNGAVQCRTDCKRRGADLLNVLDRHLHILVIEKNVNRYDEKVKHPKRPACIQVNSGLCTLFI